MCDELDDIGEGSSGGSPSRMNEKDTLDDRERFILGEDSEDEASTSKEKTRS